MRKRREVVGIESPQSPFTKLSGQAAVPKYLLNTVLGRSYSAALCANKPPYTQSGVY